ncbi:DUF6037 family protein [Pseudomonas sp. 2822-17]|jgi:hypothetical protein|uniref:DUF6037 family protein n=1 Tax=Pseudomonas sp. 2822-17 TaxID=1712678 RepID=UPI000C15A461|nr:DUF6037 family protein [Pseudomonas sp. 2822-17]PIB53752.1 hypothetical protein AOA60_22125 [Pseudomonas sp. 2822-17]
MEMTSLRLLHRSMISIGSDMQQFLVTTGAASFDCLFSTRDTPFVLTLTARGETRGFFPFEVFNGYRIRDYFGDMYGDLVAVLRSDGTSGERLKPKDFLEQLNQAIPTQATVRANPKPSEIVRLRPDIIEDREKPYFNAWIYWKEDSGRHPSEENLHKTLLLLGPEAAQHSRERNASSRWSAIDTGGAWEAS